MKRILILFMTTALLLTSCGGRITPRDIESSDRLIVLDNLYVDANEYSIYSEEDDKIKLSLYIEKGNPQADEHISIFSTMEYIGEENHIVIYHPSPMLGHTITSEGNKINENFRKMVGIQSKLERKKIYLIPFEKNGGFSEDDENYELIKAYLLDDQLRLPTGQYTLESICNFRIDEDIPYQKSICIEFTVN